MKLRALAHSRTGDKGDTSNISVIAYDARDFDRLRREITRLRRREAQNRVNLQSLDRGNLIRRTQRNI